MALGKAPTAGDRNYPDGALDPYFRVANALRPLLPASHPDFASARFQDQTTAWVRRFLEPANW